MKFLRHTFTKAQRAKILRLAQEEICLEVQYGTQPSTGAAISHLEDGNLLLKQLIEEEQFMEKHKEVKEYTEEHWAEWHALQGKYKRLFAAHENR